MGRRQLALYGLPVATAAFGVAGTVLGIMSLPVGAAVAVGGVIVVAAFDVFGRAQAESERLAGERRALDKLARAAEAVRGQLEAGMPLGGTSVPEGTPRERLEGFAQQVRERRFAFLRGRRWSDWAWLHAALLKGREDVLQAAGLTGGRLHDGENDRVHEFAETARLAASHAGEIASHYAGYDVTEEPKRPRYMPEDRDVDVTGLPAYASFADEFTVVLAELDRMASLGSSRDGAAPVANA